jgi:hypothetical protein
LQTEGKKMVKRRSRRLLRLGLAVLFMAGMQGCASSSDRGGASTSAAEAETRTPIPKDSPLAKIGVGMTEIQVRKAIGEPDAMRNYMTGKAWIPFYFGGDVMRMDWIYENVGRVIFTRNRWSGSTSVIDTLYDPNEAG